ncbi:MAG: cbb3-type cytochrome c oxidase subunit II [Acidobacteriota bacterium]
MPRAELLRSGWRGAVLVAVTYIDFLIFAQFAFLKRLDALGLASAHLKAVMGAMALGGILFSLLTPRFDLRPSTGIRLGLALSAAAALLALLPLSFVAALLVALLIGTGLGILTVTLVTHLRQWTGARHPLLAVALGTGIGYFACNIPGFFAASAETQSLTAALLCIAALLIPLAPAAPAPVPSSPCAAAPDPAGSASFPRVLVAFTALVWLDSAAFFIIQNTPLLKSGTWAGSTHLWLNGCIHLAAALGAVWILRRRGLTAVLATAFFALAAACLLLLHPQNAGLASLFYPAGVSLYSVALVAYPSILAPAGSARERGLRAGWLYAIAGWISSALGIGMGQNLGHVPALFVLAAGVAILAPQILHLARSRTRELAIVGALALAALCVWFGMRAPTASQPLTAIERGRQVYISEGCIHCHSQYVRPNSPDVLMWGPAEPVAEVRREQPPLIGNRRQGPDLAEVGARRSPLWLKAHLYDPRGVSGASIMPSYAFLFRDRRGNDLVAYLASLRSADQAAHLREEAAWRPTAGAMAHASAPRGAQLYARYCATCHSADGAAYLRWGTSFSHPPQEFTRGAYGSLDPAASPAQLTLKIARIAKFGIPGTDMPGHEYLPDTQIGSIALWLSQQIAQPNPQPSIARLTQEKNQ